MKTILILMQLGALVGIVIVSYTVPPALSWYSEPGGLPSGAQVQAMVKIPEVIRYATSKLLFWQTVAGCVGAGAGFILGVVIAMNSRKRPAPPAAEPS